MKVTQISPILNAVFGELLGGDTIPNPNFDPETATSDSNPATIPNPNLFTADLSNIVDVGKIITSSTEWGNNFDKYVGKIIDKVGRTIFRDRIYKGDDLGLRREEFEYGSILEKIRVDVGDFKLNSKWRMVAGSVLPDGTSVSAKADYSKIFDFDEAPEVVALYFNILDTYRMTMCYPRDQMESAFKSAGNMQRFIGSIQNRITTKMEVALEALDYAAECNFIGAKIHSGKNVVDLLALWNEGPNAGGTPMTKAAALEDIDFLRWCVRKIKTDKKLLARFSGKYNEDNYGTFTPADRLKVYALTDFATAMETVLRSQTYHDSFVTLDGYKEVAYWQPSSSDDFDSRSAIQAIVVTGMTKLGEPDPSKCYEVSRSGIVFVMQDTDAVMTGSQQQDVDVLYNPDGRFYKYWYGHDCKFYNDLSENAIIYTIGTDAAPFEGSEEIKLTASDAGKTIATVTDALSTGESFKYKVVTAPAAIEVGAAEPAGYSSMTSGTTKISVTAGQYIEIVRVKGGYVLSYGFVQATAGDIGT